jgi:hypothetical protein
MDNRSVLIRRTVSANAAVTFLFGALLLVDRGLVARLLGIESATPVLVAGFICVACAPVLLVAARKPDLGPARSRGSSPSTAHGSPPAWSSRSSLRSRASAAP